MPDSLQLSPTKDPRTFRAPDGKLVSPPEGWACLPPGDAGLTRRVKALGPSWVVIEQKGRKKFSHGLWAPRAHIEAAAAAVEAERATPQYAKKMAAAKVRRDREQSTYQLDFANEVLQFLRFAGPWQPMARRLAVRVTEHATPVGSGTVARTERIPVAARAEAAVVAWMRHQTTGYDDMTIARVKGKRREVRRELAQVSRALLDLHRIDAPHALAACPLCQAVQAAPSAA
jgi:hypothetical protein